MSVYIPNCVEIVQDNAGQYVAIHYETYRRCRHTKTGKNGKTPCNRAIGHGETKREAALEAREYLGCLVSSVLRTYRDSISDETENLWELVSEDLGRNPYTLPY